MEREYINSPFMGYDSSDTNFNELYKDPMFNPIMQYEQAYTYYKYLSMQMEYKIKCKEYEKLCGLSERKERRVD